MTPPEQIVNRVLKASTDLATIVGARIYAFEQKGDNSGPYVVFQVLGGPVEPLQDGVSNMRGKRVQVDCYASNQNWAVVWNAARAVVAALIASESPSRGFYFLVENDGLPAEDPAGRKARVMVDAMLWHDANQ